MIPFSISEIERVQYNIQYTNKLKKLSEENPSYYFDYIRNHLKEIYSYYLNNHSKALPEDFYELLRDILYIDFKESINITKQSLENIFKNYDKINPEQIRLLEFGSPHAEFVLAIKKVLHLNTLQSLRPPVFIFDKSNYFIFSSNYTEDITFIPGDIYEIFNNNDNHNQDIIRIIPFSNKYFTQLNPNIYKFYHLRKDFSSIQRSYSNIYKIFEEYIPPKGKPFIQKEIDKNIHLIILLSEFIHTKTYHIENLLKLLSNIFSSYNKNIEYISLLIRENVAEYFPHLNIRLKNVGGKLYTYDEVIDEVNNLLKNKYSNIRLHNTSWTKNYYWYGLLTFTKRK